jgi:hypothetical protein
MLGCIDVISSEEIFPKYGRFLVAPSVYVSLKMQRLTLLMYTRLYLFMCLALWAYARTKLTNALERRVVENAALLRRGTKEYAHVC